MRNCVLVLATMLAPLSALGQSLTLWGEVGQARDERGNSFSNDAKFAGGGMNMIINGFAGENYAFLMPIGGEFRGAFSDTVSGDMFGFGDFAIRVHNVSFGGGLNVGAIFQPDLPDSACSETSTGSCSGDGSRVLGNITAIGYSGFAKVTFGPRGRAFLQGRYIRYDPALMFLNLVDSSGNSPLDLPDSAGGDELRLTAGYTFGRTIVRVMYQDRNLGFERHRGNLSGIYDVHNQRMTIGVGYVF